MSALRIVALCVFALTLGACASTQTVKIDQKAGVQMQGKSVAVTTSDRPPFAAMTAGHGMFAMMGALAALDQGGKLIQENDVPDPAVHIGKALSAGLQAQYAVQLQDAQHPGEEAAVDQLVKAHPDAAFLLDVRTINWSFIYFPTDWNNYRVIYSAQTRLIDTASAKVVAQAFCSRVPDQTPDSPSYDQLLANNAQRLKDELLVAADHCVNEFRSKLF